MNFRLLALVLLPSITFAQEPLIDYDFMAGRWVSNCFYMPDSDPNNESLGTHQVVTWVFSGREVAINVEVYSSDDNQCNNATIIVPETRYSYELIDLDVAVNSGQPVRVRAQEIEQDALFDVQVEHSFVYQNNRLYITESVGSAIDESIYYTRQ